jgi:transposase-like protein
MATRRRYTLDERARLVAAVAANGGNVNATAITFGVPETSLRQWVRGDRHPELLSVSELHKKELAAKFEHVVELCLDVAESKVTELSPYQAIVVASIATERALQLRGELPVGRRRKAAEDRRDEEERVAALRERWAALMEGRSLPSPAPVEEPKALPLSVMVVLKSEQAPLPAAPDPTPQPVASAPEPTPDAPAAATPTPSRPSWRRLFS